MDIHSKNGYPSSNLSNFAAHSFVLDGVEIASMEGLLQALKFSDPEMQKHVCSLVGFKAKAKGKNKNWQKTGKLHWNGQEIDRFGEDYQLLLDRAYEAMWSQNESFCKALLATGDDVLEHSIGRTKESETILTRWEFCSRLTKIRDLLKEYDVWKAGIWKKASNLHK